MQKGAPAHCFHSVSWLPSWPSERKRTPTQRQAKACACAGLRETPGGVPICHMNSYGKALCLPLPYEFIWQTTKKPEAWALPYEFIWQGNIISTPYESYGNAWGPVAFRGLPYEFIWQWPTSGPFCSSQGAKGRGSSVCGDSRP